MSKILIGYEGLRERGITLSRRQLLRKEQAGTFPRSVTWSPSSAKKWVAEEVDQYIDSLIKQRNEPDKAA